MPNEFNSIGFVFGVPFLFQIRGAGWALRIRRVVQQSRHVLVLAAS